MTQLSAGDEVKVRYEDGDNKYTLDVEVKAVCPSAEFIGRIERVFAAGDGEVTGGKILDLRGREMKFKSEDVVLTRSDPT